MRRLGVLLGTVVVAVLLVGCGGTSEPTSTAPTPAQEAELARQQVMRHARESNVAAERRSKEHQKQQWAWEKRKTAEREAWEERKAAGWAKKQAAQAGSKPKPAPKSSEAEACGSWSPSEQSACELTYSLCEADAEPIVTAYYEETGPDIQTVAEERSAVYAEAGWAMKEAAFSGCLAAFFDEYDALYR